MTLNDARETRHQGIGILPRVIPPVILALSPLDRGYWNLIKTVSCKNWNVTDISARINNCYWIDPAGRKILDATFELYFAIVDMSGIGSSLQSFTAAFFVAANAITIGQGVTQRIQGADHAGIWLAGGASTSGEIPANAARYIEVGLHAVSRDTT